MYPPFEGPEGKAARAHRNAARLESLAGDIGPPPIDPARPHFAPVEPMAWQEPRDRRVMARVAWSHAFAWMGRELAVKLAPGIPQIKLPGR